MYEGQAGGFSSQATVRRGSVDATRGGEASSRREPPQLGLKGVEDRARRPGGHIGVAGEEHGAEALDFSPQPLDLGAEGVVVHAEDGADPLERLVARLRECVSLPLYGLGGLGADDIAQAREHGAQGIAAIRALWPAPTRQARGAAPALRR